MIIHWGIETMKWHTSRVTNMPYKGAWVSFFLSSFFSGVTPNLHLLHLDTSSTVCELPKDGTKGTIRTTWACSLIGTLFLGSVWRDKGKEAKVIDVAPAACEQSGLVDMLEKIATIFCNFLGE